MPIGSRLRTALAALRDTHTAGGPTDVLGLVDTGPVTTGVALAPGAARRVCVLR